MTVTTNLHLDSEDEITIHRQTQTKTHVISITPEKGFLGFDLYIRDTKDLLRLRDMINLYVDSVYAPVPFFKSEEEKLKLLGSL